MAEDSPAAAVAEEKETPESPKPKKVKKLLIIVGGLIVFMACGIGTIIFFAPQLVPDSSRRFRTQRPARRSQEAYQRD